MIIYYIIFIERNFNFICLFFRCFISFYYYFRINFTILLLLFKLFSLFFIIKITNLNYYYNYEKIINNK